MQSDIIYIYMYNIQSDMYTCTIYNLIQYIYTIKGDGAAEPDRLKQLDQMLYGPNKVFLMCS